MKPEPADAKKLKLLRYTNALLRKEGWDSVFEFVRKTGVPYTMETVRKAFYECDYKRLGADTLAIILKYLNVAPPEIRRVLRDMTADKELWTLLPEENGEHLAPAEVAWLGLYRKLSPGAVQGLLGVFAPLAKEDVSEEIRVLQRKG